MSSKKSSECKDCDKRRLRFVDTFIEAIGHEERNSTVDIVEVREDWIAIRVHLPAS